MNAMLRVLATGPRTLVQDLGRPGYAALGVSPSGAADRGAHLLANRLLGNRPEAATLEVLMGGLTLEAQGATWVVVTGAPAPTLVEGQPRPHGVPLLLRRGQHLALGLAAEGLRSYVGVLGGIAVEPVLGSRSTDTLSGLGPRPVAVGAELPTGTLIAGGPMLMGLRHGYPRRPGGPALVDPSDEGATRSVRPVGGVPTLRGTWGPRSHWYDDPARSLLLGARWRVEADSDRIGVRLHGPALVRRAEYATAELPSEGVIRGAVQVPGNGQPLIFLADHPTTGGYPVLAVLDAASADAAAQLRPGQEASLSITAAPLG